MRYRIMSAQRSGSGAVGERPTRWPISSQPAHRRLQPVVMRFRKIGEQLFNVSWHRAPTHDGRPEFKRRCHDESVCEPDRLQIVV